jgi:hypothetical protein
LSSASTPAQFWGSTGSSGYMGPLLRQQSGQGVKLTTDV